MALALLSPSAVSMVLAPSEVVAWSVARSMAVCPIACSVVVCLMARSMSVCPMVRLVPPMSWRILRLSSSACPASICSCWNIFCPMVWSTSGCLHGQCFSSFHLLWPLALCNHQASSWSHRDATLRWHCELSCSELPSVASSLLFRLSQTHP